LEEKKESVVGKKKSNTLRVKKKKQSVKKIKIKSNTLYKGIGEQ